jgi:16S rRNA (guanine(966)-N(2))-methyltransferase RsmD
MRVIAGEFRSRRLKTLPGLALRPTPDRLRETLFAVIAPHIPGCTFLDAYAGSGAVGIEALSRGAARAIFIEKHRAAVAVIRENLKALGLENRAEVIHGAALVWMPRFSSQIAFLDPPYELNREYASALRLLGQAPPPLVAVQHPARLALQDEYGALACFRLLRQGDNALSFFEPER